MSKTLKMSILLIIIALGCLFLTQTKVDAAYLELEKPNEAFSGKSVTIEGSTITLTGDVEFTNPDWTEEEPVELKYDVVELLGEGNYVLDLNGYKFKAFDFNVNEGSLTINDSKGTGEIEATVWVMEDAKLTINNGKIMSLNNLGTTIINNGKGKYLTNDGTLTFKAGTFDSLWQRGTATINGGTFGSSTIDLDKGKTVIAGNVEFKSNADNEYAFTLSSLKSIDATAIKQILGNGYISGSSGYSRTGDSEPLESGEMGYRTNINYSSMIIIKDETESIFNKVVQNGVWTVNSVKPKTNQDADFLFNAVAGDIKVPEGYKFISYGDLESATLELTYNNIKVAERTVKVVYNEPSVTTQNKVNGVLDIISKHTNGVYTAETGFCLEDLYLINFLNASTKGMDYSLALNFAKDLIKLTNGGNLSYKYDPRLGAGSPGLWNYTGGQVTVYYDGGAVNTTKIGLTSVNVLYVPNETANTDSAKIQAALKRIKDYLGTTGGITIEVGGTLSSLGDWNEHNFIDVTTAGANYYNVTINGRTYKFAICKKDSSKLETPEYLASDILSNIRVKSSSSELPLDTAITVKSVTSDNIKKALGTNSYAAYDISLYSNAKQVNITKLKDGKFTVSIPVPEILKGKEITVYYINGNGEKEEHTATVKDGVASFETNHFSTYVLAESKDNKDNIGNTDSDKNNNSQVVDTDSDKNNNSQVVDNDNNTESNNIDNTSNNPQTGDNILLFIGIALIAIVAIITTTKLKKYYKTK